MKAENAMAKFLGLLLFAFGYNLCQAQEDLKTENVFLITLDELRWQELYGVCGQWIDC